MAASLPSPSFASLINRLPSATLKDSLGNALSYTQQSRALQRLSRNANSPGGSLRQTNGRASAKLQKRAGELGIILIEVSGVVALGCNVGTRNPPNVGTVTIDTNAGTPATTDITASELDAVTWAAPGQKVLSVTVPTNCSGQALVTV